MVLAHGIFSIPGGGTGIKSRQDLLMILLWIVVLFVSILVHELGHALTSRKMTGVTPSIKLWGMGGLAYPNTQLTQKQSFWVTWAGPLAGLGFFGLIVLTLLRHLWIHYRDRPYHDFSFFPALESIVRHTPCSPK
jgi:TRAP-type C4-dicarboxylate transport system permease small subunit